MTLYVLTADGYKQPYGSNIYLVGVYTDKKEAEEVASKYDCYTTITEVKLGQTYEMEHNKHWDTWYNDKYLGGYVE